MLSCNKRTPHTQSSRLWYMDTSTNQNAQTNLLFSRSPMSAPLNGNSSTTSILSWSSIRRFPTAEAVEPEPEPQPQPNPQASCFRFFSDLKSIPVSLSEPRDVLQSERTLLTFVRFALSLNFTAIGMILNFRIETSPSEPDQGHFDDKKFNHAVSFVLVSLALCTLFISGWNYFRTVKKYSQKRIHTRATSNTLMIGCVTAAVLTLIGINVSLIAESYMRRK